MRLLVILLFLAGCAVPSAQPAPRQADGTVVSGCAMRVRDTFEPGLSGRAVAVGPIAFVTFGVHEPRAPREGALGNFKVQIQLDADQKATVKLATAAAALLFDRSVLRDDNAYLLTEGAAQVRFETCPGTTTTFVGAVITTGPTEIPVDVTAGGETRRIQLSART
ncbi:hypothetical protein DMH04_31775 [Kibdelosporangium aridum]|uniref:Lipoprotein n=1 Tax=Kibdelosporangium aridum TaxID=2030 RepID=A0A428Z1Z8_KIBAR|nr:hypothetical protein [Kibdelosporangium aridum]RSM79333.1 hypothetical protein DMH04_31775 [Kibdelosporangium aridum]